MDKRKVRRSLFGYFRLDDLSPMKALANSRAGVRLALTGPCCLRAGHCCLRAGHLHSRRSKSN